MNQVVLMGRLTKDPEMKYSNSETPLAITKYTLAVNRRKTKDNKEETDFIEIVAFGKRGEFANTYFKKGKCISVLGHLRQEHWEDDKKVKHHRYVVVAEEQYFADSPSKLSGKNETEHEVAAAAEIEGSYE